MSDLAENYKAKFYRHEVLKILNQVNFEHDNTVFFFIGMSIVT